MSDYELQSANASAGPVKYAGFWIRVLAVFIDGLVLGIFIYGPLRIIMGVHFSDLAPDFPDHDAHINHPARSGSVTAFNWLGNLLPIGYNVVLVSSRWQATIGKRAVGIYVETVDHRGLGVMHALGRSLATALSAVILGIGFLMAGFMPEKTALHDLIARTRVVYGKK